MNMESKNSGKKQEYKIVYTTETTILAHNKGDCLGEWLHGSDGRILKVHSIKRKGVSLKIPKILQNY